MIEALYAEVETIHAADLDRRGLSYFDHVIRVVDLVSESAKIVALLRDVWEIHPEYPTLLWGTINQESLTALKCLMAGRYPSKVEQYSAISTNILALEVTLAVVWDNTRTKNLDGLDSSRVDKILRKYGSILGKLNIGRDVLSSYRDNFSRRTLDHSPCFDIIISNL